MEDNKLRILPEELRRLIDKLLSERDNRMMSLSQQYELERRSKLPARERHCQQEIASIGREPPTSIFGELKTSPMFRNYMSYTGQVAYVKAILLQALERDSLTFNVTSEALQSIRRMASAALVCVMRNISHVTVRIGTIGEICMRAVLHGSSIRSTTTGDRRR